MRTPSPKTVTFDPSPPTTLERRPRRLRRAFGGLTEHGFRGHRISLRLRFYWIGSQYNEVTGFRWICFEDGVVWTEIVAG
nr:unnamed protein product [Callosobruchus chinensis]